MGRPRSTPRLVYSALDVKTWLERPPTVHAVRPAQCPRCAAPGQPLGAALGLWGHGVRRRQLRGPLEPAGPPRLVELVVRRYRCRGCTTVVLVVPRGVVAGRLYAASAIGLAFALFGVDGRSAAQVRAAVSPWRVVGATAAAGGLMLRRWVRALQARRLFARLTPAGASRSVRAIAARAARALSALAQPAVAAGASVCAAFVGAVHAG